VFTYSALDTIVPLDLEVCYVLSGYYPEMKVVPTILCNSYSLLSLLVFFSPQSQDSSLRRSKGGSTLSVYSSFPSLDEKREDGKNLDDLGSSLSFLNAPL